MTTGADLAKCLAFIGCQLGPGEHHEHLAHPHLRPTITLSRQTGSGAMEIALKLADFLQERAPAPCGWTVFDKNIVVKMLEEHDLPTQLARFLPEGRISRVRDMIEEVLGLHPPSETLVRQIGETVVHLAELGHTILVGRATNVITRRMKNVFHVSVVAPLEKRVAQVIANSAKGPAEAQQFIRKEDAARRSYLKEFFSEDPDNVLLYDLVINTARFTAEDAARTIGEAVLRWVKKTETA
jgi:cytidylate kinase